MMSRPSPVAAAVTLGARRRRVRRLVRRAGRRRRACRWPRRARCRCWCSPARRSSRRSASSARAGRRRPRWPARCCWRPATAPTAWRWRPCSGARWRAAGRRPARASTRRRRWRWPRRARPARARRSGSTGCAVFVCWNIGTLVGRARRAGHRRSRDVRARRRLPGRLRGPAGAPPAVARRQGGGAARRRHRPGAGAVRARRACRSWPPALAALVGLRPRSPPVRWRPRCCRSAAGCLRVQGAGPRGARRPDVAGPPERCVALLPAALLAALIVGADLRRRQGAGARRPRRRRGRGRGGGVAARPVPGRDRDRRGGHRAGAGRQLRRDCSAWDAQLLALIALQASLSAKACSSSSDWYLSLTSSRRC